MRTSELIGPALDWAVAKASGEKVYLSGKTLSRMDDSGHYWQPSTDWAQGGPIIERESITLDLFDDGVWMASEYKEGPTPLVAAMRAYVTAKMGEEINVPEELA